MKILADSGCDIPKDIKDKVKSIPLTLQLGDNVYIDDENMDYDTFIQDMVTCTSKRKSAAPSPESFLKNYEGDEDTFVVTLSSKLSGSYNSAVTAKNIFLEDMHNKFIHIVDSFSAGAGETVIVKKLVELSEKGLSKEEIVNKITNFVSEIKTYFILEDYSTFVNSGRLSPSVAKLASLMNIVPICGAKDGEAILVSKAIGEKKALSKLVDIMLKEGKDFEEKILAITHVRCYEKALAFRELVSKKIHFKDIIITEATGLCSFYGGDKGLILAF